MFRPEGLPRMRGGYRLAEKNMRRLYGRKVIALVREKLG
jgi:hypothetical protein